MAQLADRIAYRLAGMVWTAIYSGLSKRSSGLAPVELASMGFERDDESASARLAEVSLAA
jgi:hypothetical protein